MIIMYISGNQTLYRIVREMKSQITNLWKKITFSVIIDRKVERLLTDLLWMSYLFILVISIYSE